MNETNCFHDWHTAEVARALSCIMDYTRGRRTCHKRCPYAITVGEDTFCDAKAICEDAHSTLVVRDRELMRHDIFLRWLAHVVTTDVSNPANMELICRKLAKIGYLDVGDDGEWREAKRDAIDD